MTKRSARAAGWIGVGMRLAGLDDVSANRLCIITETDNRVAAGLALAELPQRRAMAYILLAEATADDQSVSLADSASAAMQLGKLKRDDRSLLRRVSRARSLELADLAPALAQLGPKALIAAAQLAHSTEAAADDTDGEITTTVSDQRLATIIETARTEAGMSREELATELDVSPQTIRNWEDGVSRPRDSNAAALIEVLDLRGENAVILRSSRSSRGAPEDSWLRLARKRAGLTQSELAELSGVSKALIAHIETQRRVLTEDVRSALAPHLASSPPPPAATKRSPLRKRPKSDFIPAPDSSRFSSALFLQRLDSTRTVDMGGYGWADMANFSFNSLPSRATLMAEHGVPAWRAINPAVRPSDVWAGLNCDAHETQLAIGPSIAWLCRHGLNTVADISEATDAPVQDLASILNNTSSGLPALAERIATTLALPIEEFLCPTNAHKMAGIIDPASFLQRLPDVANELLATVDTRVLAGSLLECPTSETQQSRRGVGRRSPDSTRREQLEQMTGHPVRTISAAFGLTVRQLLHLPLRGNPGLAHVAQQFDIDLMTLDPPERTTIDWWDTSYSVERNDDPADLTAAFAGGPLRDKYERVVASRFTVDRWRTHYVQRCSYNLLSAEALATATGIDIADVAAVDEWRASPLWTFAEAMAAAGLMPMVVPHPRQPAPSPADLTLDIAAIAAKFSNDPSHIYPPFESGREYLSALLAIPLVEVDAILNENREPSDAFAERFAAAFFGSDTVPTSAETNGRATKRLTRTD